MTPEDLEATAARYDRSYGCKPGDGGTSDQLRAGAEAMRDSRELRFKLQAMHRRAQRSEGKAQRSECILASVAGAMRRHRQDKTTPSLWHLWQDIEAARDHARSATGRAFSAHFNFYYYREKELEARLAAAEAKLAALRENSNE